MQKHCHIAFLLAKEFLVKGAGIYFCAFSGWIIVRLSKETQNPCS